MVDDPRERQSGGEPMTASIYQELTRELNSGRTRAILSSGQAVVAHGLAMASKDGDWVLRGDQEAADHVLRVLAGRGARYRFGAPLDPRWMGGGWSAHLEYRREELRIRTDFVARPARISPEELERLWNEVDGELLPVIDLRRLALIKRTNREKDYPIIGELARKMASVHDQLLHSRSARDILALSEQHPEELRAVAKERPLLARVPAGREALEVALDAERRELMRANESRLQGYVDAARAWAERWKQLSARLSGMPLIAAHATMVAEAELLLPFAPEGYGDTAT